MSTAARRTARRLIAIAALALALPLAPTPAAVSASQQYVALGDSYSSGVGTRSYLDDGSSCQRSTYAYPSLISAARGYALNFRACSGATIPDVTNAQLSALSAATTYVTISVGGNDAGFADVLTECAQPWWMSSCDDAIDTAQAFITNTLPGKLATLYASIRSRATAAKVVVVGYPRIFNGEDCNAGTWFSPAEETRLNATADLMNSKTSSAAAAKGFAFADPTSRFVGHAVCDKPEWINGLSSPISESYHPNRSGQASGYTPLVSPLLTGIAQRPSAATLRSAAATGPALASLQREYAALDAGIEPQQFRVPDLTTRRARLAARDAGVDLGRWLARH